MIIVIDGPDGSGKTTISKKLVSILKNAGVKVEYKKFELALDNLILSKLIYATVLFFTRIKKERYKEEYGKVLLGMKNISYKDKLTSSFIILDKTLASILMKLRHRNKTLILDAYIYDNLIPFYCRRLIPKSILEFIIFLKPLVRGDVEIILDGPTNKLFERRKGTDYDSLDFVKCNRKYFRVVAKAMKSPVIYVDTPVNITIRKTLNMILKQLPGYSQEEHIFHLISDPFNSINISEMLDEFHLSNVNWVKIMYLAKKQKLLLPTLQNMLKIKVDNEFNNTMKNLFERVVELKNKRLQHIKEVVDILNENRINYAVFKSLTPFDSELDTDLDILIDIDDLQKTIRLLREYSWEPSHTALAKNTLNKALLLLYPSMVLFKEGFEIDLHPLINWGSFMVSPSEIRNILRLKIVKSMEKIEFNALPNELEVIFTITHAMHKHDRVNLWDMYYVRSFIRRDLDLRVLEKLSLGLSASLSVNTFLFILKLKNIFYYKDEYIERIKLVLPYNTKIDWKTCVPKSEIILSRLRCLSSYLMLEHEYNFFKQIFPYSMKYFGSTLTLYKEKFSLR